MTSLVVVGVESPEYDKALSLKEDQIQLLEGQRQVTVVIRGQILVAIVTVVGGLVIAKNFTPQNYFKRKFREKNIHSIMLIFSNRKFDCFIPHSN